MLSLLFIIVMIAFIGMLCLTIQTTDSYRTYWNYKLKVRDESNFFAYIGAECFFIIFIITTGLILYIASK